MFMRTATWQSDNGFTIHLGSPTYVLDNITDSLSGEAQPIKAPGQDGATTYTVSLGQPRITVSGYLTAAGADLDAVRMNRYQLEDELRRAFMPNRFGLLTDNRPNGSRRIRCRPLELPSFGNRMQHMERFFVDFVSDDARWEAVDETITELGREVGGFRFPLVLSTRMGFYTKKARITNDTGEDIYPIIEIYSASAFVTVANDTTGKKVQITRPILDGQKMVIDCEHTTVDIFQQSTDGAWELLSDVSMWLTFDSEYWPLIQGENNITLQNEQVGESLVATIRYREPV